MNISRLKLYHFPATRSARVKWLLHELLNVSLLADLFPEKGLAPAADVFSLERADYLQMLHFGTSTMDMMLWQIRIHTHMLGADSDARTIARYQHKFTQEVEPQLTARLQNHDYICAPGFSAVDCVMGQNVLWAQAYGLCQGDTFAAYVARLAERPAFAQAYADMAEFSLAPPESSGAALAEFFTG